MIGQSNQSLPREAIEIKSTSNIKVNPIIGQSNQLTPIFQPMRVVGEKCHRILKMTKNTQFKYSCILKIIFNMIISQLNKLTAISQLIVKLFICRLFQNNQNLLLCCLFPFLRKRVILYRYTLKQLKFFGLTQPRRIFIRLKSLIWILVAASKKLTTQNDLIKRVFCNNDSQFN